MDSNTTANAADPTARNAADDADRVVVALLDTLVERNGSVFGAVLATADGLPLASVAPSSMSPSRLSAMGSALLGLCDAAAGESRIGSCNDVIVDAAAGRLLAMSVDYRGAPAVLMAVATASAPLGHVLWSTRACAQAITRLT